MDGTERIPESIIGIHIAILYLPIVRTVIDRFPLSVELIKFAGEEQGPVEARVKGTQLLLAASLRFTSSQITVPFFSGFFSHLGKALASHFATEIDKRLCRTYERGGGTDG